MLAEKWNGAKWVVETTPDPAGTQFAELSSLSCRSSAACTAVGDYTDALGSNFTLAERLTASWWVVTRTPNPAVKFPVDVLSGVSCQSSSCVAVGYDGISALSVVSSGMTGTLSESWNGARWVALKTSEPAGASYSSLTAVSCFSASSCTSVGAYTDSIGRTPPLIERWNGKGWRRQTAATPPGASESDLQAISCPSATTCTAVGRVLHLSGGAVDPCREVARAAAGWSRARPSCRGSRIWSCRPIVPTIAVCEAVGIAGTDDPSNPTAPIAERWNGSRWDAQSVPTPKNGTDTVFVGVSCHPANLCTAVGDYVEATSGARLSFVERWNGSSWKLQKIPTAVGEPIPARWNRSRARRPIVAWPSGTRNRGLV